MASGGDSRQNQIQAYTSWVNAQLKKKLGRQCISDLVQDMQDGTAFADLIEVVAGESLSGIIHAPSTKQEMLSNVEKVIRFMIDRNIRMHVTHAEDIVSGRINSIMRLVLALAAHYKPNSVRESRNRSSLASYAQSAAVSLAEARRDAAAIVQRPRKPNPIYEGTPSDGKSFIFNTLQKSASQDFVPGFGDARYRALAESFTSLSSDHKSLKADYSHLLEVHEDVIMQMKLLKKAILLLQQVLLENKLTEGDTSPADVDSVATQFSAQPMTADEVALLCSRLLHSEETRKDIKDELSKMRHDYLRREGAEAGLQQLVEDHQSVIMKVNTELMKVNLANQSLENTKSDLERQLNDRDIQVSELTKTLSHRNKELSQLKQELEFLRQNQPPNYSCINNPPSRQHVTDGAELLSTSSPDKSAGDCHHPSQRLQYVESPRHIAARNRSKVGVIVNHDQNSSISSNGTSTRLVYFYGHTSTPHVTTIDKCSNEVTLSDVHSAVGCHSKCRYQFDTSDSHTGVTRREIKDQSAVVPCCNGTVTVWIEDIAC